MKEFRKFLQIALPCLTFSPGLALDDRGPEVIKAEINSLVKAAKEGCDQKCELLSRKYFYYAAWLQKRSGIPFGQHPFEYFLLQHNQNPSVNLEILDDPRKSCQVRIVELVDAKKKLVKDINTGEELKFRLKFKPGGAMLQNLDKLPHLVIAGDYPKIHILNPEKRKRIKDRLSKLNFEVGPWVDLEGKFYVMHWGVLCYKLQDADLVKEIPSINFKM